MEKRPFKIGQKVKILDRRPEWEHEGPTYTDAMLRYVGLTFTIRGYSYPGFIRLWNNDYHWHPDWLVPIKKINVARRRI